MLNVYILKQIFLFNLTLLNEYSFWALHVLCTGFYPFSVIV